LTESAKQQAHYEAIHDVYEQHYSDASSMAFRNRFVYDFMFEGQDLNGKVVADLACGSGHNSLAVLDRFPRAQVMGFDVSKRACEAYRQTVGREAFQVDLTAGVDLGRRADVAMVFGGLHHCVSNLEGTFRTISPLVRPGGLLLMWEPNRQCFLEGLRWLWYRLDRYFEATTEHALSEPGIRDLAAPGFEGVDCRYMGGPAYFLVCNSLVLRVPAGLKRSLAAPLFGVEAAYNRLPGRFWFPTFIARWRRKG
jgi:SAM-dependent methyltransferase